MARPHSTRRTTSGTRSSDCRGKVSRHDLRPQIATHRCADCDVAKWNAGTDGSSRSKAPIWKPSNAWRWKSKGCLKGSTVSRSFRRDLPTASLVSRTWKSTSTVTPSSATASTFVHRARRDRSRHRRPTQITTTVEGRERYPGSCALCPRVTRWNWKRWAASSSQRQR